MQSTTAADMLDDYERLRLAALTSTAPPIGTRSQIRQLLDHGLHVFAVSASTAGANDRVPTCIDTPSSVSAESNACCAIVQLLASMTLQSLTEDNDVYLQRQ